MKMRVGISLFLVLGLMVGTVDICRAQGFFSPPVHPPVIGETDKGDLVYPDARSYKMEREADAESQRRAKAAQDAADEAAANHRREAAYSSTRKARNKHVEHITGRKVTSWQLLHR